MEIKNLMKILNSLTPRQTYRLATILIVCSCYFMWWAYVQLFTLDELLNVTWRHDHSRAIWLVGHGKNVNVSDDRGRTALMWAAQASDMELVRLYVRHGAEINARDSQGRTALTWAEYGGDIKIIELIRLLGGEH